jgi:Bifunctional DNA primase/polymerase, N-terminal
MTPLGEEALCYAVFEQLPVFPCRAADQGAWKRKSPHTPRGFHDASNDPGVVTRYWERWPDALIGMPTGRVSCRWVLDIDVKDEKANGFDTLEDLGHSILPETPMVHTPSGGLHVYFEAERQLGCSVGLIGPGLDVRGDGGYVILPSEGSGYSWDPLYNFNTVQPVPAPDWLWPPRPSRPASATPIEPVEGLSRYAEAAIDAAFMAIRRAPNGEQECTLNAECFSIGTLAGAGAVPKGIALRALLRAAAAMPDYDASYPWRVEELNAKVRRAFDAGVRHPREARHGRAA